MWGAYIAKTLVKRDVTVVQSVSPERGRRVMGLPRRDRPHQAGGVLGSSKCGCCGFLGASRKAFQGLIEGPVCGGAATSHHDPGKRNTAGQAASGWRGDENATWGCAHRKCWSTARRPVTEPRHQSYVAVRRVL